MEFQFYLLVSLAVGVASYPTGTPESACVFMRPKHEGVTRLFDNEPYEIMTSHANPETGREIVVTIRSKGEETFKGFLLEPLIWNFGSWSGQFTPQDNTSQPLKCGLTHTSNDPKTSVSATYVVPHGITHITFRAVVMKDFLHYWHINTRIFASNPPPSPSWLPVFPTTTRPPGPSAKRPSSTTPRPPVPSTRAPSFTTIPVPVHPQQETCKPGWYYFPGNGECEACSHGEYQDLSGQDSCKACEPGYSTLEKAVVSSDTCYAICKPGFFLNTFLQPPQCQTCPKGQWLAKGIAKNRRLSTSCLPCPQLTTTLKTGATSEADCVVKDVKNGGNDVAAQQSTGGGATPVSLAPLLAATLVSLLMLL